MADINIHAPGYVKDNSAKGLCSVFVGSRGRYSVVDAGGAILCDIDGWLPRDEQYELALRFAAADQMQKALEAVEYGIGMLERAGTVPLDWKAAKQVRTALALAKGETV